MQFSQPRYTTGAPTLRLAELESSEPRPVWAALDAASAQRFTGEMTLTCSPAVQVWFVDGSAYYAERVGDPTIAERLIGLGVVSRDEIARGEVRVGSVSDISRLFRRVPSLDRDRVEVGLELLTAATLGGSAEHVAESATVANYRHHPSGVHKWHEAHRHWDDELADALRDALADEVTYDEPPGVMSAPSTSGLAAAVAPSVPTESSLLVIQSTEWNEPLEPIAIPAALVPHEGALEEWHEHWHTLTAAEVEVEGDAESEGECDNDLAVAEDLTVAEDLQTVEELPVAEELHVIEALPVAAEPPAVDETPVIVLLAPEPEHRFEPVAEPAADLEPTILDEWPSSIEQTMEPIVIVAPDPIQAVVESTDAADEPVAEEDNEPTAELDAEPDTELDEPAEFAHPAIEPVAATPDPLWQPVIPDAPSDWAVTLSTSEDAVEHDDDDSSFSLADLIGRVVSEDGSEHDDDPVVSDDIREAVRAALAEINAAARPLITQGVTAADAAVPTPAASAPMSPPPTSPPLTSSPSAPVVDGSAPNAPHGSLRRLIGGRGR